MPLLDADYLVVGAGAVWNGVYGRVGGRVRRGCPGGGSAAPTGRPLERRLSICRLHQPSAYYGVNSRALGSDSIDERGPNAGFYERASGAEICDYYQRVLDEHLLASGQVRFLGMHDYTGRRSGEHQLVNRLTGEITTVRVRRKLVDATYLESSLPSTHTPSFDVDPNASLVTPNELVGLTKPGSGYTVIGAGKTSMDTCNWLLDNGVPPEAIRWIRPRDPWTLERLFWQPQALLPWLIEGVSRQVEAAAEAADAADLFRRLESCGQFIRLDPEIQPATFRGAILSEAEREGLRQIENVVRQDRVLRIATDEIVLKEGWIATDRGQVTWTALARAQSRVSAPRLPAGPGDAAVAAVGRLALQRSAHRVHRSDARQRCRQEPALPTQPAPWRGRRLGPSAVRYTALSGHLAERSRYRRVDGAFSPQPRPRYQRTSRRSADAVPARSLHSERRTGAGKPGATPQPA